MNKNEIGVCIDEGVAYILEEKKDENLITIIKADEPDTETRQAKDRSFYKKVIEQIQDFEIISLFATSKARNEIVRRIRAKKLDHIVVQKNATETVTENQKIDFINGYFKAKC